MEESYKKLEDARNNSDKLINEEKELENNYKELELEEKEYNKTSLEYNRRVENIDQFVISNPFLNEYKEQIPQKLNIEENEKEKNVEEINNNSYNTYQDQLNKEGKEHNYDNEIEQKNEQEETALTDPEKENRFRQFFKKIKEKIKAVVEKITGKEVSDRQIEEVIDSKEVQDELDELSNNDIGTQETLNNMDIEAMEFRQNLSRSNMSREEIAEAAIKRYEEEQQQLNKNTLENPVIG